MALHEPNQYLIILNWDYDHFFRENVKICTGYRQVSGDKNNSCTNVVLLCTLGGEISKILINQSKYKWENVVCIISAILAFSVLIEFSRHTFI